MKAKVAIAALTPAIIVPADIITKRWALATLVPGESIPVAGGLLDFTLTFNQGAAFSMYLGEFSRWIFLALSVVAIVVLAVMFRSTPPGDRVRLLSLALIAAGAGGNLIDRVRWAGGVVDFIGPLDLGFMDFPIFNVADMAITCGAALLLISLLREPGREPRTDGAVERST